MTTPDHLEPALAPPPGRRWNVKDMALATVLVLALLFVISSAVSLPAIAAWGEESEEANVAAAIGNLLWYVVVIVVVMQFVRRRGGTGIDLGLRRPDSWGRTAGIVCATFLLMYFSVGIYQVIVNVLDLDFLRPSEQVPEDFYDQKVALAVLGVAVVIGAPVTEEIFFRGFLFGGTRTYIAPIAAAIVTGFVFSLAHLNFGLIIPFALIGALLAMSYQRSGTLFAPIAAHFMFNFISFMLLAFVPEAR